MNIDKLGTYAPLLEGIHTQEQLADMDIPESAPIFAKEYKIEVVGSMQSGKSMLVLNIAQDLVEGRDILAYFPWDSKLRVMYVNFELPEAELVVRLSLLGSSPLFIPVTLPMMRLAENPKPVTDYLEALRRAETPVDCLILDAKMHCFGDDDENQTNDNIKFCAACDEIIRQYNICLIVVHHYGKNETPEGRGNTSFGAWTTKRLELRKSKNWASSQTHKRLYVEGKVGEPLELEMVMEYPKWKVVPSEIIEKRTKVETAASFILDSLPKDRNELMQEANKKRITTSTFNEVQKRLEVDGKIRIVKAEGQGNRKRIVPVTKDTG